MSERVSEREVSFRSATEADARCLHALGTQVFLETYATAGIRESLAREAQAQFSVAAFQRQLANPAVRILLAERKDHLVAFAQISLGATHVLLSPAPAAELSRLYVQSPFIGRSVGTRLIRRAEALGIAEGAAILWLTAWVGNARAITFYASRGYQELGVTEYVFEGEHYENRLFAKRLHAET